MSADNDGCAFAAYESGGHENPSVSPVKVRARWTDNFTPVLARNSKFAFCYFAGRCVDDLTTKSNWV
jgi:hypothetical protein